MKMDNSLIELAKSVEMQNLFSAAKDISNIKIFENNMNFSKIQMIFLSYLYIFNNLYTDIMLKKVSKKVIENKIYWDSYSYYKREKPEEKKGKKERDIHLVFPKKYKKRNK
jgi:hypothetical protein